MNKSPASCPLCGGTKKAGKTTFTVDLGFGVVVVREVPATVCSQCGADWIEDVIAEKLERIVEDARKRHKLTLEEAQEKLDCLSSFVSDEEYNVIKVILENWGR